MRVFYCPQCGHEAPKLGTCARCGRKLKEWEGALQQCRQLFSCPLMAAFQH